MKPLFSKGILLSVLMFSLSNCKKDNSDSAPTSAFDIDLKSNTALGQFMTNNKGQTLYMFSNDADGGTTCTGACAVLWPPFVADLSTVKLNAGLHAGDFSNITLTNGKSQIAYKGWPLYTYSPAGTGGYGGSANTPEPAGSVKGDGFGGIWFVAKPDYSIMLANKQLKGLDGKNYRSEYSQGDGSTIYFTDGAGRTIYTFSVDSFNINKFTKSDLSNNKTFPVYEQELAVTPSTLDKSLFGNINVFGKKQMTYKGWPLYYFGQDSLRGLTLAVSVPTPGKWPVAVKDIADPKK
jgi:predicted lipoprotein with Yx(FWY)xxD motif